MALIEVSSKIINLLDKWKDVNRRGAPPTEILKEICDLLETHQTNFLLQDPDPFPDRNRAKNDPDTPIGYLLKTIYDNDEFMSKLCTTYMFNHENDFELNFQAARILLSMSTLQGDDIFIDVETHVNKLLDWAKDGQEPLRSYSCGLLEKAMQMPECPAMFKDKNAILVGLIINRLKILSEIQDLSAPCVKDFSSVDKSLIKHPKTMKRKGEKKNIDGNDNTNRTPGSASRKRRHNQPTIKSFEYNKPDAFTYELTVGMQQKLLLQYLYPMGEYQESLPIAFDLKVIETIFHYINPKAQPDAQLACNALLYLSSLLCHKKYIVEFISRGGIQRLLDIPQPSAVATMSSLCFYYIAYSEDSMERVCLLPQPTLHNLIKSLLSMLECAHVSGKCHASLFFSMSFSFRSILTLFDSMDGLRKVVNMISTLRILRTDESMIPTDDEVILEREMVKNACLAIQKYYEAHLAIIADDFKRISARERGSIMPAVIPPYKSMGGEMQDNIDYIKMYSKFNNTEKQFFKKSLDLNIPLMLMKIVALAADWNYNYKSDVIISALEALSALSISKRVLLAFNQQVEIGINDSQSGIRVILRAVEGDLIQDIQIQKSALSLLCNCVVAKKCQETSNIREDDRELRVIKKIWSVVRLNNGIKILLSMINIKTPITEADAVRALVCKALCGLSDDPLICQVLGKLPIFHNEQLQLLMREPILSDKTKEYVDFYKHASTLIEKVTGKTIQNENLDPIPSFSRLTKSDIIAQTKITYPQKELLQIIHSHLLSQGLDKTADSLRTEANLPLKTNHVRETPQSPFVLLSKELNEKRYTQQTPNSKDTNGFSHRNSNTQMASSGTSTFASPMTERKSQLSLKGKLSSPLVLSPVVRNIPFEENNCKHISKPPSTYTNTSPTLDSIVTGYLRQQHAQCTKPVATCPPFSLMRSHRCPEPRYRSHAPGNIAKRVLHRQSLPPFGGIKGRKHNKRYIYSKYRSTGCIKETDEDCKFTVCTFLEESPCVFLGTRSGDVKMLNYYGQEELFQNCHTEPISSCSVSKDCRVLLTASAYDASGDTASGAIWGLKRGSDDQITSIDFKYKLPGDHLVQFNHSQEKVVGTEQATAHVYDVSTGQLIRTFFDENNANNYRKNYASFCPGDELLLNDGVLWDIRAKSLIHKFDKFNDSVGGVFHPSGLQIIINSEVWDIRKFHLLDTYAAMDQCRLIFSSSGDVIYGLKHMTDQMLLLDEDSGMLGPYDSSFRVFDACDYSAIAIIDVKKTIHDFSVSTTDQTLGIIENTGALTAFEGDLTCCRFYDIGRVKKRGEEDSDEEQDEDSEEQSTQLLDEDDVTNFFNNILANGGDDFEEEDIPFFESSDDENAEIDVLEDFDVDDENVDNDNVNESDIEYEESTEEDNTPNDESTYSNQTISDELEDDLININDIIDDDDSLIDDDS